MIPPGCLTCQTPGPAARWAICIGPSILDNSRFMGIRHFRLYSGLVLLAYVSMHLLNHAFGVLSPGWMNAMRVYLVKPWQTDIGLVLLYGSFLIHFAINIKAIWQKRVLRIQDWQVAQVAAGLAIPVLLLDHVVLHRGLATLDGAKPDYYATLILYFTAEPWRGWLQVAALLVTWFHGCLGLYHWLKLKSWFPKQRYLCFAIALLLPAFSLAGFIAGGNAVTLEAAQFKNYDQVIFGDAGWTEAGFARADQWRAMAMFLLLLAIGLFFLGRYMRGEVLRRGNRPHIILADGRQLDIPQQASVLETFRMHQEPIAAVCGGHGRCTTCRVQILAEQDSLPSPTVEEQKALDLINAGPHVRLACQLRPTRRVALAPLLPPAATARDGRKSAQLLGRERQIVVLFLDLRDSTRLAEGRLPFDVVFLLNHFFEEMSLALDQAGGHFSQSTGDGLMAIFGLEVPLPTACRQALDCAADMLARLDRINISLEQDLPAPLRVGIGINAGPAIVGEMGPPVGRVVSAIGDAVNTASRLEALCKQYHVSVVLSEAVRNQTGLDIDPGLKDDVVLRGHEKPTRIYTLQAQDLPTSGQGAPD